MPKPPEKKVTGRPRPILKFPVDHWKRALNLNEKGEPKYGAAVQNALLALENCPLWAGAFRFNEFTCSTEFIKQTPWGFRGQWSDAQDLRLCGWLQGEDIHIAPHTVGSLVNAVAHANSYHPIREYLDSITWDEKPRLDRFGITHFHCKLQDENDERYITTIFPRFMISAVARILNPGVKADAVLVLRGPQGWGKSSALKILFGEGFSDDISDLASKDAKLGLMCGVWGQEIPELDAMRRSEVSTHKAFFSRQFIAG